MLTALIYIALILLIITLVKIKLPALTGKEAENFVARKLKSLDSAKYRVLRDLMLPSTGNLLHTQIDFVVISNFGIFCVEVKAYKGWIFGSVKNEYWTQVIFKHKEKFYSPFRQNYAHIQAIQNLIGKPYIKAPIVSFVIFTNAEKLEISGTDLVGNTKYIINKIKEFSAPIYTDAEMEFIYNTLVNENVSDRKLRKLHSKGIRNIQYSKSKKQN